MNYRSSRQLNELRLPRGLDPGFRLRGRLGPDDVLAAVSDNRPAVEVADVARGPAGLVHATGGVVDGVGRRQVVHGSTTIDG